MLIGLLVDDVMWRRIGVSCGGGGGCGGGV